ncbi:GntR family transcriptional regulator [Epibacterium sp. Ofav1-8]|uniref:GntR family transcriptional regulator n=1 Tax=Epibacterium sp. Ofav1-8 TaxID=2917735 RepID=UPI001EF6F040|nr:GntR family transcriptional regulator [Epibacterium sp. Ofav1-8]MCG7625176.1 GntR family transcriptional regulator [Epibacterium sp. Ofav1-8]
MTLEKKKSQADQTTERLRELVLSNDYVPGQALRQTELAELLGVSRTPVREALKELATEGLVEISPTGRTVVASIDPAMIKEYYEVRCQLEIWMLKLAIPVLTAEQLDQAFEINEKMANCNEAEWSQLNFEFHRALSSPANKPHTLLLIEELNASYTERLLSLTKSLRDHDRSLRDHRDIIEACHKGDVQGACDRMESHILLNSHALIERLVAVQANT